MGLAETLADAGGKAAIGKIASKFGLPESVASKAVGMILPALTNGMSRNVASEGGLGSLLGALASGDHDKYLDEPSRLADGETVADGNGILGHILGNKDASRAVAATVAGYLGIENDTVKKMMPLVAAMAMGGLAKQSKEADLPAEAPSSGTSDLLGQLGGMLGSGGASDLLGALFK